MAAFRLPASARPVDSPLPSVVVTEDLPNGSLPLSTLPPTCISGDSSVGTGRPSSICLLSVGGHGARFYSEG